MASPVVSFRITGAKDARGRVHAFSGKVLAGIRKKADIRAEKAILRFKQEMAREYTSAWATGQLARGITFKSIISGNGVDVQFFIADRRELRYVTAALGGHFQQFPVGPFVITPTSRKFLKIPFPGSLARRFIRGPEKGQFAGSAKGGAIFVRQVLWGKRSGGFSRDVISEVAQEEGALFVQDMQAAVQNSIVEMTS